jgi:hypothetical protein
MKIDPGTNPEQWVRENRETLLRVIRHGDDSFTRGLAIAALVKYGPDPSMDQVIDDIRRIEEVAG